jgi:hypothetical protein
MKRSLEGACTLVICLAFVSVQAGAATRKQIKLTGIDTGGIGRTKELGTGLKNPPSCKFPKTITLKKGKRVEGALHFTRCTSNGGTGFVYVGHAKLKVGTLKGYVPHMRVDYGIFSPNGNGQVSTLTKSESLVIKGSLPLKRGTTVPVVLGP